MAEILLKVPINPDLCKDFTDFQVCSIRQGVVCFSRPLLCLFVLFCFALTITPEEGHYPDIKSKLDKNNVNTCIDYRY